LKNWSLYTQKKKKELILASKPYSAENEGRGKRLSAPYAQKKKKKRGKEPNPRRSINGKGIGKGGG